jgi:hypothetical protein
MIHNDQTVYSTPLGGIRWISPLLSATRHSQRSGALENRDAPAGCSYGLCYTGSAVTVPEDNPNPKAQTFFDVSGFKASFDRK